MNICPLAQMRQALVPARTIPQVWCLPWTLRHSLRPPPPGPLQPLNTTSDPDPTPRHT